MRVCLCVYRCIYIYYIIYIYIVTHTGVSVYVDVSKNLQPRYMNRIWNKNYPVYNEKEKENRRNCTANSGIYINTCLILLNSI